MPMKFSMLFWNTPALNSRSLVASRSAFCAVCDKPRSASSCMRLPSDLRSTELMLSPVVAVDALL